MNLQKKLYKKHLFGQTKYGEFTFLTKDMKKETQEELIDAINYQIYEFIKRKYSVQEIKNWDVKKLNRVYRAVLKKQNILIINRLIKLYEDVFHLSN